MLVLHEIPWCCFLLQDGPEYYLDVLCNHSAAYYSFLLHLNAVEVESYRTQGPTFLQQLADDVQYSAPGVVGSRSAYLERKVSDEVQGQVNAAILAFRKRPPPS